MSGLRSLLYRDTFPRLAADLREQPGKWLSRLVFLLGPWASFWMVEILNENDVFSDLYAWQVLMNLIWYYIWFVVCRLALGRRRRAAALAAVFSLAGDLDILALGVDTARSLGLAAKRTRLILLALAAALAGAAVSFSGLLGFVGLIVPHIIRSVTGQESRLLLAASALGGAAFLTASDLLARLLFAPYELPVGIILSLAGGPFFIVLLLRQRGGRLP